MLKLILASQSPRRKQLLNEAGYQFQTITVHLSEIPKKNLSLDEQIMDLAHQKSVEFVHNNHALLKTPTLVLTADTVVVLNHSILGKPKNPREAQTHLESLSGKTHSVKTGFCFYHSPSRHCFSNLDTTFVTFKTLSSQQIMDYVHSGDPLDKAGSYGIQGPAIEFVEKIEGSFSNVVGLPLEKIKSIIKLNEWDIERL